MSVDTTQNMQVPTQASPEQTQGEVLAPIKWKMPITYALVALLNLYFVVSTSGIAKFSFNRSKGDRIQLPLWEVSAKTIAIVALIVVLAVFAWAVMRAIQRKPAGVIPAALAAFVTIFAMLAWFGGGSRGIVTVTAVLASALALSTPLIFGSLSGVVSEHVGIVNIAIEGQLLVGAFAGVLVASIVKNVWAGLLVAPIAGALIGALLAFFCVNYNVDNIIVGVVLNVFALGLTTFFFSSTMTENPSLNDPTYHLSNIKIPILADIPIIGPVLFNQTALTYIMYVVLVVLTIYLYHSRWGLRMRACGEHPHAADTVGIDVRKTRWHNVLLSGALAGLGGAYFTIGASIGHSFNENMSAGNGYIALAAMILGKWHPLGALGASLMFGFAKAVAILVPSLSAAAPSHIINMIPYIVTILAVAGFVGVSRPPASENIPYTKG